MFTHRAHTLRQVAFIDTTHARTILCMAYLCNINNKLTGNFESLKLAQGPQWQQFDEAEVWEAPGGSMLTYSAEALNQLAGFWLRLVK